MAIQITARSLADTQQADMASGEAIQPVELSGLPEKSAPLSQFFRRSLRWTRRNFSSRARLLSGGEVVILSAPKSGRTWIRTFLCAYLCKRHGLDFTSNDYLGFAADPVLRERVQKAIIDANGDDIAGRRLSLR